MLLGMLLALAASGAGAGHTNVVYYHPTHMSVAKTGMGSCWEGSIAANRSDAFRCMVGNSISDPCFVRDSKSVACPDIPTADRGLLIKLIKPLPPNHVSGPEMPWAMVLDSGISCRVGTGTVMPGYPYYCSRSLVCAEPTAPSPGEYVSECGVGEAGPSGPQVGSKKRYLVVTLWR